MKCFVLAAVLIITVPRPGFAQSDTTAVIIAIETKLKNNTATVSSILTDKTYVHLHPHTPFRELIKKYASTGAIGIATTDEPGNKIKVTCTVKNAAGQPVANALVYLYQTDARGWYAADAPHVLKYEGDLRHARLFGYVKTNEQGIFELHTVKPSGYPKSDLPAHIHLHVTAAGYASFGTEFLFDDDERLKGSIRSSAQRSGFIIAKPGPASSPFAQQFSYAITLQKE